LKFISAQDAMAGGGWDVVAIGSGFGSLFFLHKYLERRPNDKVLILEKGGFNTLEWQLDNQKNSPINNEDTYRNGGATDKPWAFTIGLGGSTNCWWGMTPRLHPSDFQINTLTGAGVDWPLRYDDLVPYYREAEEIMLIAGPDDVDHIYPGSSPYPQPPHRLTTADEMMRSVEGHHHFAVPTARLTRAVGDRSRCCSTATCNLCPVNSKFNALNGMSQVLSHPSVSICLDSEAGYIETAGGVAKSVTFKNAGKDYKAACDLCVLGANAIHSPFIMLRSGISGHGVGRYLGEKMLAKVEVLLDGLDHFDGGTATTAYNITLLEEGRTSERASAIYVFENRFEQGLRLEHGRWRQTLPIEIFIEDHFDYENGVFDDGGDKPLVKFNGFSSYCHAGLDYAMDRLPGVLKPLPVEDIKFVQLWPTMGHVQGSLRMGQTIEDSVVDKDLICHSVRNLAVVGTSVFPTSGSMNPSLTAAALSLRSAEQLLG